MLPRAVGIDRYAPKQGDIVTFLSPYATYPSENAERQTGMVLSTDGANQASDRYCICPLLKGNSSANEVLGIPTDFSHDAIDYLRPDLATYVDRYYSSVTRLRPCSAGAELFLEQAIERLIEIFTPTQEKLSAPGKGFLAYGQVGWLENVPFINQSVSVSAPVLCLTPASIYAQTGIAIVTRAYSNLVRSKPVSSVEFDEERWLKGGFFSTSEFMALSTKRIRTRSGQRPFSFSMRIMKAYYKKAAASFIVDRRMEVMDRYAPRPDNHARGHRGHLPISRPPSS